MTLNFPDSLLSTINSTEVAEQYLFVPAWAPVYNCLTIDEFNALLIAEVGILNARYRFNAVAHGDWVATDVWYRISSAIGNEDEKNPDHLRPLNSWVLKDPIGFVPNEKELQDEVRWRKRVAKLWSSECVPNKSLDELHSYYVREACKDMCCYERLLIDWYRSGLFCDQEEWIFSSAEEKKNFRQQIKRQRFNVLNMREKLELFQKTGAPKFLISLAAGQSLREKRILNQMHDALSICS